VLVTGLIRNRNIHIRICRTRKGVAGSLGHDAGCFFSGPWCGVIGLGFTQSMLESFYGNVDVGAGSFGILPYPI
jgi:hypothetical protein